VIEMLKQEGNMRRIIIITLVVVLGLCLAALAFADSATKGRGRIPPSRRSTTKKESLSGKTPMYLP
jgi:hypothetical protein